MAGILGSVTGWTLLMPAALVIYPRMGGGYAPWDGAFLGIAVSAPMLAFSSIAGMIVLGWTAEKLTRSPRT